CIKKVNLLCTNNRVFGTICKATEERQTEAEVLSKQCDRMIVIGARHSSNTIKLYDVCRLNCETCLVESAGDLDPQFLNGANTIGVTAGASTPSAIIKEVLEAMSEVENKKIVDEGEDFEAMLEESLANMSNDQRVTGVIVGVTPTEIQVDIGRKQTGYIKYDEWSYDPTVDPAEEAKVGDEINCVIMKTNDAEGTIMLSKRRYDSANAWSELEEAVESEAILEGTVTDINKGGVIATTEKGIRVFIPASLATESYGEKLDKLLKTKVKFKIIEVNKPRKRAVGSIKAVLQEERKAAKEKFWETAEVGQTFTGVVKSLTNYGAFVDIGGVDGMIHISELSWKRIKHPNEVLSEGDTVEVYIKSLENDRISLGYKKDEDNPWVILQKTYQPGDVVEATIVGLTAFGAFANIIPGIDGLIHISQIADRRIEKPQDVLSVGEVVKTKITEIDYDKKRVSLSIRALEEDGDYVDDDDDVVEEDAE
ncbi:MAG: S1 RNA-binding domain-containing protein, partial [Clostridia bacterium]|nr:S1 RNA-binding domain-containing protein [Clostridia bacterium]